MLARGEINLIDHEITVILLVRHYAGRYGPGMRVTLITPLLVVISARAHTPHEVVSIVELSPGFERDSTMVVAARRNVFRSTDAGIPAPNSPWPHRQRRAIQFAHDFEHSRTMYAITGASLRRSTNAGIRWTSPLVDGATLKARALAVSARQLFVIDNEQRLLRATDRGARWQSVLEDYQWSRLFRWCCPAGEPQVQGFAEQESNAHGANGPIFYGVTESGGVFRLSPTPKQVGVVPADAKVSALVRSPELTYARRRIGTNTAGSLVVATTSGVLQVHDGEWVKLNPVVLTDLASTPDGVLLGLSEDGCHLPLGGQRSDLDAGLSGSASRWVVSSALHPPSPRRRRRLWVSLQGCGESARVASLATASLVAMRASVPAFC